MAIEQPSKLVALASIDAITVPGTPTYITQRGFAEPIAFNAAGDYELRLDQELPQDTRAIAVSLGGNSAGGNINARSISLTVIRVFVNDNQGLGIDNDFIIQVLAIRDDA